jgi:N-acetyltransferase
MGGVKRERQSLDLVRGTNGQLEWCRLCRPRCPNHVCATPHYSKLFLCVRRWDRGSWSAVVATHTTALNSCHHKKLPAVKIAMTSMSLASVQQEHLRKDQPPPTPTPSSRLTREHHELYLRRLGLDDAVVPHNNTPTVAALAAITEAHVGRIPFENLSQHGGSGGPQTLHIETIADKVLRRQRGGFCLELNALLAEWLLLLGYQVKRVPAIIYADKTIGFRNTPTHLFLLVTCPPAAKNDNNNKSNHTEDGGGEDDETTAEEWFVDVAFGEPSIHPLQYVMGLVQTTPEGMESRLTVGSRTTTMNQSCWSGTSQKQEDGPLGSSGRKQTQ